MGETVGVAGVVAALSVVSDLARGHQPGEAVRACLLATELARRAGLDERRRGEVYYGTLMRFAGCAATSHEIAAAFGGDDIVVRARGDLIDPAEPGEALEFLAGLGVDAARLRELGGPAGVGRLKAEGARADCEVGADLTARLGLPDAVRQAVLDSFERFDGHGVPAGRAGTEIAEASRFAAVGYAAVMFDAVGGGDVAARTVARWSGRALDPEIAAVFADAPGELLAVSSPEDPQSAVTDAEPGPRRTFRGEAAFDEALAGFGDAADLKSPWFTGHSRGVAALARTAAGLVSPADATAVYRAGLLHDLGRVAVPAGVWERPGPLRAQEWEQVRLHPYQTGRILSRSAVLAPLGLIACRHHERVNGSGYPAGIGGAELDTAALAQARGDHADLARAALGLHAVGAKTGPSAEREQTIALLQQAAGNAGPAADLAALVNAALARDLYHSLEASRTPQARQLASDAVTLARQSGDLWTLARCLIATHDVCWRPGSARDRLTVLDELLALARQLHSADLTAQTRLLRATALLELGTPAAHAELDLFCRESEQLGDAAARWDAQSRRAAAALLAGRLEEADALIGAAGHAAEDMGNADAVFIHDIQRWELARFQAGRGSYQRRRPGTAPPVETWPPWLALQVAEAGDRERAAAVMAGFHVEQADGPGATTGYDLWFPSIAAEAAARCGTSSQRRQLYHRLLPLTGTHVVCGAAVAYAGAVDHYLGLLAASLGEHGAAAVYLEAAVAQHHQIGASAWAQLSASEQARLGRTVRPAATLNRFQRDGALWHITYRGTTIRMPDSKGLRDIATLLTQPREPVRATQLAGLVAPAGADPVLDDQARAAYKARLTELDQDIDDATTANDLERAARAVAERDALISELTHAVGLGGRSRRLGDDSERARKAVTARIHHAIDRIQHYHPGLAAHLRTAIRTGTACTYQPAQPVDWNL